MAKRTFVTYHVLEGEDNGATDESEIDPWMKHLEPGAHVIAEDEL